MKRLNAVLDVIALTPEQLAKEEFLRRLPMIAVLVVAVIAIVALVVHYRRK